MSFYRMPRGDFFGSMLSGAGNLASSFATGAVGSFTSMLGGAVGTAFTELLHSDWGGPAPWDKPEWRNIINFVKGENPQPAPQYASNFGWTEPDRPLTRAGPPISAEWGLEDTTPPIYQVFTQTYDEGDDLEYSDLYW